ncbi:hypothetical protein IP70_21840 [alpha proteobacterium AAP38]|nr:hypothetical protein IP70_21840 [alpha proteobacterium AAP38]
MTGKLVKKSGIFEHIGRVMLRPSYILPDLPSVTNVEKVAVLKATAEAHRYLAEVNGMAVAPQS